MENATETEPSPVKHLWEHDHPYYCEPGSFFKAGQHHRFASWADFATPFSFTLDQDGRITGSAGTALYSGDLDQNLLFRWDWKAWHLDPDRDPDAYADGEERHVLMLFFMLQRKGANCSAEVAVTAEDEPAVRAWLAGRVQTVRDMWAPFLDA
ncbi:hypothetical protein [Sinomonas atrocyanea]